jgi:pyruvate/2-oxoglutarate dehydrogenase complex dihydrolipoamide dehydrogenase (E3) component
VLPTLQSEAVELKFNAKEINVSQDGNGISIKINGVDKEIKGSHLLLAVGRSQYRYVTVRKHLINFDDILPWMTIVKLA